MSHSFRCFEKPRSGMILGCFIIFSTFTSCSMDRIASAELPFITFTANMPSFSSTALYTTENPPSATRFYITCSSNTNLCHIYLPIDFELHMQRILFSQDRCNTVPQTISYSSQSLCTFYKSFPSSSLTSHIVMDLLGYFDLEKLSQSIQ